MISNANKPQRYITHVEVRAIQPEMIGYEESEEGMNMSGYVFYRKFIYFC
jgi:hypothetical protein